MSRAEHHRQHPHRAAVSAWTGVLIGVLGACEADRIGHLTVEEGGDLRVGTRIHRVTVESAPDRPAVFKAADLRVRGDSVVVSDNWGDQIVIMDTTLAVGRTIGRSGRGPGELHDPMGIEAGDGWIAVAEITNGRISFFNDDGSLQRHVAASSLDLAVGPHGRVYVLGDDPAYYLTRIDPSGARRPFGRVPVPDEDSFSGRGAATGVLWAATSGAVHVFDNGRGILLRFGPDGIIELARRLPRSIDRLIRERIAAQRADFGGAPVSTGMAKDLAPTEEGDLFLTFSHPEFLGLLIDADAYSARVVQLPDDQIDRDWLRSATAVILAHDRLYAVARGGLGVFALQATQP